MQNPLMYYGKHDMEVNSFLALLCLCDYEGHLFDILMHLQMGKACYVFLHFFHRQVKVGEGVLGHARIYFSGTIHDPHILFTR